MKRAGRMLWGALSAASTIQYAAGFLAVVVAIVIAGYANLPTGFRVALGVALFGFVACLLIALIPLLPASIQRKHKPQTSVAASAPSPYAQAAQLQRHHDEQVVDERRALREVREELRDNRRLVQRASDGDRDAIEFLGESKWVAHGSTLLDIADSAPHAAARNAYRELAELERTNTAGDLLETDLATTLEAIDNAIKTLDEAESKRSR